MIWQMIWAMVKAILFPKKPSPLPTPTPPIPKIPKPQPKNHKQKYLWVLDNGHGALTTGKRSAKLADGRQLMEYEFNRDVVARIQKGLFLEGIAFHILVPEIACGNILKERIQRVHQLQSERPKILVSIHANAYQWPYSSPSGIEVWYKHADTFSQTVATIFQAKLIATTKWIDRGIKSKREKQFYLLRKAPCPAILTENGFYTNPQQVQQLLAPDVRQAIAQAHIDAILEIETTATSSIHHSSLKKTS